MSLHPDKNPWALKAIPIYQSTALQSHKAKTAHNSLTSRLLLSEALKYNLTKQIRATFIIQQLLLERKSSERTPNCNGDDQTIAIRCSGGLRRV